MIDLLKNGLGLFAFKSGVILQWVSSKSSGLIFSIICWPINSVLFPSEILTFALSNSDLLNIADYYNG